MQQITALLLCQRGEVGDNGQPVMVLGFEIFGMVKKTIYLGDNYPLCKRNGSDMMMTVYSRHDYPVKSQTIPATQNWKWFKQ